MPVLLSLLLSETIADYIELKYVFSTAIYSAAFLHENRWGSGEDADGTCLWPKALLADGGRIRLTCLIENREKAGRMRYIYMCVTS
jgi:hypothetical protein